MRITVLDKAEPGPVVETYLVRLNSAPSTRIVHFGAFSEIKCPKMISE